MTPVRAVRFVFPNQFLESGDGTEFEHCAKAVQDSLDLHATVHVSPRPTATGAIRPGVQELLADQSSPGLPFHGPS